LDSWSTHFTKPKRDIIGFLLKAINVEHFLQEVEKDLVKDTTINKDIIMIAWRDNKNLVHIINNVVEWYLQTERLGDLASILFRLGLSNLVRQPSEKKIIEEPRKLKNSNGVLRRGVVLQFIACLIVDKNITKFRECLKRSIVYRIIKVINKAEHCVEYEFVLFELGGKKWGALIAYLSEELSLHTQLRAIAPLVENASITFYMLLDTRCKSAEVVTGTTSPTVSKVLKKVFNHTQSSSNYMTDAFSATELEFNPVTSNGSLSTFEKFPNDKVAIISNEPRIAYALSFLDNFTASKECNCFVNLDDEVNLELLLLHVSK